LKKGPGPSLWRPWYPVFWEIVYAKKPACWWCDDAGRLGRSLPSSGLLILAESGRLQSSSDPNEFDHVARKNVDEGRIHHDDIARFGSSRASNE
jgi:hypothetical protein